VVLCCGAVGQAIDRPGWKKDLRPVERLKRRTNFFSFLNHLSVSCELFRNPGKHPTVPKMPDKTPFRAVISYRSTGPEPRAVPYFSSLSEREISSRCSECTFWGSPTHARRILRGLYLELERWSIWSEKKSHQRASSESVFSRGQKRIPYMKQS